VEKKRKHLNFEFDVTTITVTNIGTTNVKYEERINKHVSF